MKPNKFCISKHGEFIHNSFNAWHVIHLTLVVPLPQFPVTEVVLLTC